MCIELDVGIWEGHRCEAEGARRVEEVVEEHRGLGVWLPWSVGAEECRGEGRGSASSDGGVWGSIGAKACCRP
jgi:hypothetical protein